MAEPDDTWVEYRELTRFLHSSMIAFDAEAARWSPIVDATHTQVGWSDGTSRYRVHVPAHLAALKSRHVLGGLVLLRSWGHCERFAKHRLGVAIAQDGLLRAELARRGGFRADERPTEEEILDGTLARSGVEHWGTGALAASGRDWTDVFDGKAGLVEVSAVRNAVGHGANALDSRGVNRIVAAGGTPRWSLGQPIELDYQITRRFRDRIRSFGRLVAGGSPRTPGPASP